jgi:hypothetical protein
VTRDKWGLCIGSRVRCNLSGSKRSSNSQISGIEISNVLHAEEGKNDYFYVKINRNKIISVGWEAFV